MDGIEERRRTVTRFDLKFVSILVLYCVVAAFLIPRYQYQISPDSISYISLAKKYIAGDFANAINGIWAPLYTWLLIPFLWVGAEPLLTSVILTAVFGLLLLPITRSFLRKIELSESVQLTILVLLVPVLLSFAFSDSPPDFLVIFFLMLYLNQLLDHGYSSKRSAAFKCGLYGSLAYYSKAFALPFFFVHFLVWNLILYVRTPEKRNSVFSSFLLGVGTFLGMTIVWIGLISLKYERLTFSTAGKFNYLAAGPESGSKGGPYYYEGLFPPSNETALNGWEDPTFHEMPNWSPFESEESFKYAIKLVINNSRQTLAEFRRFSSSSDMILAFYFLLSIIPISQLLRHDRLLYPLLTLCIYSAGYIVIVVESRYYWLNCILLAVMGGYLLHLLFESRRFTKASRVLLLALFAMTFIIPSVRFLKSNLDTKRETYKLSQRLAKDYGISGNIAANHHHSTMYIAYHLGARYYGQVRPKCTPEELKSELLRHKIDYFFVWGEPSRVSPFLKQFREITAGQIPHLRVYSLNERT